MAKTDPPSNPLSFEAALKRLEEIVHSLEEGDIGLQESLERYEEGVKLLRQSYELLERAERRIELFSGLDAEGNPITAAVRRHGHLRPGGTRKTSQPAAFDDSASTRKRWLRTLFGETGVDEPGQSS